MELTKKNCMIAKNRMRGLAYASCNCREENIDEVNNCDNYLEQLMNEHFDNPPLNQWIPVEERLPENISSDYLVTLKYHNLNMSVVQCARITPSGRWMRRSDIGEIDVTNEVIAWMPLPEAYEGNQ